MNAVAGFVLELLKISLPYLVFFTSEYVWCCLYSTEKVKPTSKMSAKLCNLSNNFETLQLTFDVLLTFKGNFYAPGSSTPGLLVRMETADSLTFVSCVSYAYILCTLYVYADFNKNGKKNWKNTKLLEIIFEYSDKPQTNFQCRSLFCSWVI